MQRWYDLVYMGWRQCVMDPEVALCPAEDLHRMIIIIIMVNFTEFIGNWTLYTSSIDLNILIACSIKTFSKNSDSTLSCPCFISANRVLPAARYCQVSCRDVILTFGKLFFFYWHDIRGQFDEACNLFFVCFQQSIIVLWCLLIRIYVGTFII